MAHDATRPRQLFSAVVAVVLASLVLTACSAASPDAGPPSSNTPTTTDTTIVGTLTKTVTSKASTTIPGETVTVTSIPTDPTEIPPPASTPEPEPTAGECPYLSNAQVSDANGQRTGKTTIIAVDPYPICLFTRSDGRFLAATRIIVADTPEEAAAAVNQHVPVSDSDPVSKPAGWTGGAMGQLDGLEGYPEAHSIYAVSKETIAIIAISNQAQSVKGRQMVNHIVANLDL